MEIVNKNDNIVEEQPTGERWDPLGAPNDQTDEENQPTEKFNENFNHKSTLEKLKSLEEEQELLNSSLFALTTHFAQVQFRLRQVVNAPIEDRNELLKSLEEFAFRGIPDVCTVKKYIDETSLAEAVRLRRSQQTELINRLKLQLKELEQYAFENGEYGLPQDVLLERQRIILNELKERMNLEIDEQKLASIDVKQQINLALDQLISPIKIKEHLVTQLKTQIADLERFIYYLQTDNNNKHKNCSCGCSYNSTRKQFKGDTIGIIHKTAALLQMFAILQLGCGTNYFKKNDLKNTMKVNHYGDLRAKLELAIIRVKEIMQNNITNNDIDCNNLNNIKLITTVRKYLAISIRDLMQHGATTSINNSSLIPFIGCFPKRTSINKPENLIHSWEIILEYYHLMNGEKFNSTPARKLSLSFNLDIGGSSPNINKHNMLSTIGSIISSHTPYKRSCDSHFKAFICAALNSNKLVSWLNLIFSCSQIIKNHYYPWSYVSKTGFQDSLKSLDTLTCYKFDLPVDLAIKQFQNIKDIFT